MRPLASEYADPRAGLQPVAQDVLTAHTAHVGKRLIVLVAVLGVLAAAVAAVLLAGQDGRTAPAAAGPPAVLLIPGYGGGAEPLVPLESALAAAGFETAVLDIGDGTGDLTGYAAAAVSRAQELIGSGAESVSLVGFSAGGLISRIAADEDPAAFDAVITLASPHEGTLWAALAGSSCPTACQQMAPGSDLLQSLPPAPSAADWLSVYSTTDEVIVPATSSALPGSTVVTVQSLTPGAAVRHGQVPSDPAVIDLVVDFLSDDSAGASP